MKLELTRNEMLALWKRRHFLEPLRTDCSVTRTDSIDLDALCAENMRQWYLQLLAEGDPALLAPADISSAATLRRTDHGTVALTLPDNAVRVLAVRLEGWEREAVPVAHDSPDALRMANSFACGGVACPVAVVHPDRTLELYSPPNTATIPKVDMLLAAADTGPETYAFDERALALIGH